MPKQKEKIVIVLAGDMRQFKLFKSSLPGVLRDDQKNVWTKDTRYYLATKPEDLYGIIANEIMRIGTFGDRDHDWGMLELARTRLLPKKYL